MHRVTSALQEQDEDLVRRQTAVVVGVRYN